MNRNLGSDDRRQVACGDGADEIDALMGSIAERRVGGLAAAAKGDRRAATQAKRVASLIDDFEISFNTNRAVVENCHSGAGHDASVRTICAGWCPLR